MNKAIMNWSGGKDSSLALYYILKEENYQLLSLLTSINKDFNRISMHGVRRSLLEKQAQSLGQKLETVEFSEKTSMTDYNAIMGKKLQALKSEGLSHSIYGDIFLEDLRDYRDKQLNSLGLISVYPLWKRNTLDLVHEFIDLGFKAISVCVNSRVLSKDFVGRLIDRDFIKDLPKSIDPCGEYGEFHSFVFDGPIFSKAISFQKGEIVERSYQSDNAELNTAFYFCDLKE